jgi:amino acid transporter
MWGSLTTTDTHRAGAVLCLVLVAMFAQGVAQILASSRYAYALARDKGQNPLSFRFKGLMLLQRQPYLSQITSLMSLKRNGYLTLPFGGSPSLRLVSGFRLYPCSPS